MTNDPHHPAEIRIAAGGERLEIAWGDGALSRLGADRLRVASRSAGAIRARLEAGPSEPIHVEPLAGVTITDAEAVGSYALRLFFSDGHDRGIFPWRYLRDLAA